MPPVPAPGDRGGELWRSRDGALSMQAGLDHPGHHAPAVSRAHAIAAHEARGPAHQVLQKEFGCGQNRCDPALHLLGVGLCRVGDFGRASWLHGSHSLGPGQLDVPAVRSECVAQPSAWRVSPTWGQASELWHCQDGTIKPSSSSLSWTISSNIAT